MKTVLIESDGKGQKAYNSLLLKPKMLSILANELALSIVTELSKKPGCAMDLARKLEVDEQKIYYHIRKLENAKIIKLLGTEMRYGMTAKIYKVNGPVVAAKLYEDGHKFENDAPVMNLEMAKFFSPFVKDGKLNATVIIGDGYSHGRFDAAAKEGSHVFDLALMLGSLINHHEFPHYVLDTEVRSEQLKDNLILIGNSKTNTIVDRLNSSMPLFFDEKRDFAIISPEKNKVYDDPRMGMIVKMDSPFRKGMKILVLGGRTRGTKAAIMACTQHVSKVLDRIGDDGKVAMVVKGFDGDGDKVIDNVEFLE